MGRTKGSKNVQEVKQEVKTEYATAKDVSALADALVALSSKIDTLTTQKPVNPVLQSETPAKPGMPQIYRQIIDETLSPYFSADVLWRTDGNFELNINIPKQYSNATESHWALYKMDSRPKVIPNALAENGVKEYCEKIAQNLGAIIMNKVREDKAK